MLRFIRSKILSGLHLVFLSVCLTGALAGPAKAESLVLANGEWPPYFSKELPHGGYGSRVVKAAFELVGIKAEYRYMPWKRGYEGSLDGEYAGSPGWAKAGDRQKDFLYSDPILTDSMYFYHTKAVEDPGPDGTGLAGHMVGMTSGYLYQTIIEPYVLDSGGTVAIAMTDLSSIRMLAHGRIDYFPCSDKVFDYLAARHLTPEERARIVRSKEPYYVKEYYLILSRKLPNVQTLMERFNEGLRQLKLSGSMERFWLENIQPAQKSAH